MYPQTSFTFHTREYGERIEEQKTFVFNPCVNAVNGRSGAYYSTESLGQIWTGALRRAGLRHRKAYQSRHTFACWALSAGANPNYVASQMGHSDAQMVYRVYGAWMSENNTDQLSLINTKMSDLVLRTCSTKVAV
ncbi:tyrosine-type recombinase/integrase [Pantoea agglomerans]|jgi:integrase|nr:putative integrase [Pantoea agglomerans]